LKRRLRARGRTPADANECEQSGEASNHLPAMSHRSPLAFRNSRREVGATLKIILADIKRCGGGKSGDSDAAASRFGTALASLSFDSFSRILSSAFTVATARSPVTPSNCSLMGVIMLGAAIGSGNGFVSPKMREIHIIQHIYVVNPPMRGVFMPQRDRSRHALPAPLPGAGLMSFLPAPIHSATNVLAIASCDSGHSAIYIFPTAN
jgi:hypothetical protein